MRRPFLTATLLLTAAGCLDPNEPGNLVPETVSQDPTLPHISINGTMLHAEAFGDPDAPLVITLHGGPGSDYRSLLPLQALADEGYRVVFWDQRGAGLSERHDPDSYSLNQYLEDLRLVIEHYTTSPTQPLVLIARSWGAMYATWFINEHGDYGGRLRGAVLTEPGAFSKRQLTEFMDAMMDSVDFFSEPLNDATWSRQFMSPSDHERADYFQAVMTLGVSAVEHNDPHKPRPFWRSGAVVYKRMLRIATDEGFDWTTHLDEFGHKVLFLRGELNAAAPLEHQRALAASYADAEIITIVGTGHQQNWEKPEEYLSHVRDYFAEIGFEGVVP